MASTARVVRLTASGALGAAGQKANISAVQIIGGTAATTLHDDTTNGATTIKLSVTAPSLVILEAPIHFEQVYVQAGVGATDILIHLV